MVRHGCAIGAPWPLALGPKPLALSPWPLALGPKPLALSPWPCDKMTDRSVKIGKADHFGRTKLGEKLKRVHQYSGRTRGPPRRLGRRGSPLHVAREGTDDAVLAAIFVAALQRHVLGLAELERRREAIGTAGSVAVDREGRAVALERHHDLAVRAGTFRVRGGARRIRAAEVERIAVGRAGPERHRACGVPGRNTRRADGDADGQAGRGLRNAPHTSPPP